MLHDGILNATVACITYSKTWKLAATKPIWGCSIRRSSVTLCGFIAWVSQVSRSVSHFVKTVYYNTLNFNSLRQKHKIRNRSGQDKWTKVRSENLHWCFIWRTRIVETTNLFSKRRPQFIFLRYGSRVGSLIFAVGGLDDESFAVQARFGFSHTLRKSLSSCNFRGLEENSALLPKDHGEERASVRFSSNLRFAVQRS